MDLEKWARVSPMPTEWCDSRFACARVCCFRRGLRCCVRLALKHGAQAEKSVCDHDLDQDYPHFPFYNIFAVIV